MKSRHETYDFLIIGGGLFGVYAALYLHRAGHRVLLVEKDQELMRRASLVNQARLHGGYHYPRSIATAKMSDDNKVRFTADHQDFILGHFKKYYAIDRYGSFTDASQFERFCNYLKLPCERIRNHPAFSYDRLEALYLTREDTFDPVLIAAYYREQIQASGLPVLTNCSPAFAERQADQWLVCLRDASGEEQTIQCAAVLNATYAGTNQINRMFGVREIELMHEISEIALLHSSQLKDIGLTVMDGPFGSIMPFGRSGLHSLSSVAYTHHEVSYRNLPEFNCQHRRTDCQPDQLRDCKTCFARPKSNFRKMKVQMGQYFREPVDWQHFQSYFTIKSKLKASHIDDGRPTEISVLQENPYFYCIFAGKINSIYEVEKIL
ncbi:MAG: FAD-binding oxidoreductase [Saprospiraceae bacterium]|nr:FAD-binding oxidoreductase [Saprospiraceae bacterium]